MLEISESDITFAESKLLPPGRSFDEERRTFIRSLHSCDVIACPGSGKTTALLAKLLILGRKTQSLGGGGICVLTHTNVAINEIKKRLGNEVERLLSYPNFFGTIQSFVDRYLASPCFIELFNKRLTVINTEHHLNQLARKCMGSSARPWIAKQIEGPGYDTPSDLLRRIELDSNSLTFDLRSIGLTNTSSNTHVAIQNACNNLFRSGIISYRQAYNLAEHYLLRHPTLDDLFTMRFRFILIDEMQDSYAHQIKILDTIFPGTKAVVQKVGDPNQAIFSTPTENEMEWAPRDGALTFSNSMRFGQSISSIASKVRTMPHISIRGNDLINSHKPHIITYNDSCITRTIPSFGNLIQKLNLDKDQNIKNKVFKAVGWVGKHKDKTCIPHYWRNYSLHKNHFEKLCSYRSYIKAYDNMCRGSHSPKTFQRLLYEGFTDLANKCKLADGTTLTQHCFKKWLKTSHCEVYTKLQSKMSQWFLDYLLGKSDDELIAEAIAVFEPLIMRCSDNRTALAFISSPVIDEACKQDSTCNLVDCLPEIQIEVGTVHSVKGETHTATLLLSTFYHKNDIEYLIPFLLNKQKPKKIGVRLKSCIKIAHVAMSRPTHLFAIACHENSISDHLSDFSGNGWIIMSVDNLLA